MHQESSPREELRRESTASSVELSADFFAASMIVELYLARLSCSVGGGISIAAANFSASACPLLGKRIARATPRLVWYGAFPDG